MLEDTNMEESESSSERNILAPYLNELRNYPLLTREEEMSFSKAFREGDDLEARNKLVLHNLRLALMIAKKYAGHGIDFPDLVQIGSMGLMRAAELFDYRLGFRFTTYAWFWVHHHITRAIHDQSRTIRFPDYISGLFAKILKASGKLAQKLGREPNAEEVAEATGLAQKTVRKLFQLLKRAEVPLEAEVYALSSKTSSGSNPRRYSDIIPSETVLDPEIYAISADHDSKLIGLVKGKLLELSQAKRPYFQHAPKNVRVFETLYGLNDSNKALTLKEAGEIVGVCREGVRQVQERVWKKLQAKGITEEQRRLFEVITSKKRACQSKQKEVNKKAPR